MVAVVSQLKQVRLLGIHLVVFVHKDNLAYVTNVESEYTRTGVFGMWVSDGLTCAQFGMWLSDCLTCAQFGMWLSDCLTCAQFGMWLSDCFIFGLYKCG